MDWIDIAIVAFALVGAVWGYRRGIFVSALSLAGFAAGAFAGGRLAPHLLSAGAHSRYAPLVALAGSVVLGWAASSVLGAAGLRLRGRLRPRWAVVDGAGGAVLLACASIGVAWLIGLVVLQATGPGELRREVQDSHILRRVDTVLPPSGGLLNALARVDPIPQIAVPVSGVTRPNPAIARDPAVAAAASSVVRITGTACGLGVEGSGWIARDGEVVTAAHVVAGESGTSVQPGGTGPSYPATVIWFDARNDVAVLRVPALRGVRPLPLRPGAPSGTAAAVLGFPEDGPYDVEPARLGPTSTVLTDDAYGNGPVTRAVTALRGLVRPGNSGGPVVDARGRVVTTIFGGAVTGKRTGYGVADGVVARAISRARGPVEPGPCT